MNRPAVMDLEFFVWEKDEFLSNKQKYYLLEHGLSLMLPVFRERKTKLVINPDMMESIFCSFPFNEMNSDDSKNDGMLRQYFAAATFFLTALPSYKKSFEAAVPPLTVSPEISKTHFKPPLLEEIAKMVNKIFFEGEGSATFFTMCAIWLSKSKKIEISDTGGKVVANEVLIIDNDNDFKTYQIRKMKRFDEEYKKHILPEKYSPIEGSKESQLSCYKGKDVERCQSLLDLSEPEPDGNRFYYFDRKNDVWVVFIPSFGADLKYWGENLYHGHDQKDESQIPTPIIKMKDQMDRGEDDTKAN